MAVGGKVMKQRNRSHPNAKQSSERALQFELSAEERLNELRDLISDSIAYARKRRAGWARWSTAVRMAVFFASAGATVTLGFAETDAVGKLGFVLSAIVTSLTALESFFNWRSRWIGAEIALADWYELDEELRMSAAASGTVSIEHETISDLYTRYRAVWSVWSKDWINARNANT